MEATIQEKSTFTMEKAAKYLSLYLGVPTHGTWEEHIGRLFDQRYARCHDYMEARASVKKSIAFALMLKYKEKSHISPPYQNILFTGEKWNQFNAVDWVSELDKVIEQDEHIQTWRNQALSLGVVYPIEYSPVTRQAFNWLFDRAESSGAITPENKANIVEKFQKLVLAYGGTVICNVFIKNESKVNREVISWETNYFFERLIFQVYSVDQILKIKKQELQKTNPKLVKKV